MTALAGSHKTPLLSDSARPGVLPRGEIGLTELPRSRALVRLDGPGHIMPVEPVTPRGSTAWRVIHLPVVLAFIAVGLLCLAVLAIEWVGVAFSLLSYMPGIHYLIPLIGAGAAVAIYWLFVRMVENRTVIEELGSEGWFGETLIGFLGGLVLSGSTFAILAAAGAIYVVGFNSPSVMLLPLVVQLCTAVILEIVVCGLGFRLIERLLGSWSTLLITLIFFAAVRYLADAATPLTILAVSLEAGVLFALSFIALRRLWAPIGLHAAWKFAQIGLYGAAVTDKGPQGYVVSYLDGPDWLTGGQAGSDASVPAIAVAAIFFLVLAAYAARRGRIIRPVWQRGRMPIADAENFAS